MNGSKRHEESLLSKCPVSAANETHIGNDPYVLVFNPTLWDHRRQFRRKMCRRTFCRNRGPVYHLLQHRRATFDEVAALSVDGMNKSAISILCNRATNSLALQRDSPASRPGRTGPLGSGRRSPRAPGVVGDTMGYAFALSPKNSRENFQWGFSRPSAEKSVPKTLRHAIILPNCRRISKHLATYRYLSGETRPTPIQTKWLR